MKIPEIKDGVEYKAVVCARCGEVLFLTRDESGYFEHPPFENPPSDWGFFDNGRRLCPDCSKKFVELKKMFILSDD